MSTIGNIPAGGGDAPQKTTKAPGQPQGGAQNVETNLGKPQSLANDSVFVYAKQDIDRNATVTFDESPTFSNWENRQKSNVDNWLSKFVNSLTPSDSSSTGPMQKTAKQLRALSNLRQALLETITKQKDDFKGIDVAPEEVNANIAETTQKNLDTKTGVLIENAEVGLDDNLNKTIKDTLAKYEALARQEINSNSISFGLDNNENKPQNAQNNSRNSQIEDMGK